MATSEQVEKALTAANAASVQARNTWITFLLFGTYLAVTVGATTHHHLLLEGPVTLPLLDVELDLFTFYWVAPGLLLLFHLYLLIQLYVLAGRLHALRAAVARRFSALEDRNAVWRRVDPFVFAQMIAGERRGLIPWLAIRAIVIVTMVLAPVVLLLAFQVRFLPYHSEGTIWWHRGMVLADLGLLWALWPIIVHPPDRLRKALAGLGRPTFRDTTAEGRPIFRRFLSGRNVARAVRDFLLWQHPLRLRARPAVTRIYTGAWLIVVSGVVAIFALLVATMPGESIESWLLRQRLIEVDEYWLAVRQRVISHYTGDVDVEQLLRQGVISVDPDVRRVWWLTAAFFEGGVKESTRGVDSVFSRNLVLPDIDLVDDEAAANRDISHNLRARDLRHAVLYGVDLHKADLSGADLQGADLGHARLANARFECLEEAGQPRCTNLKSAHLSHADLQRASFSEADLQKALLVSADLRSADLGSAHLEGAALFWADLRSADLTNTDLQGASLAFTDLQGATLREADLHGADLTLADLQGADLSRADLQGALLTSADFRGADLTDADLQGAKLLEADLQGADLRRADLQGADLSRADLQGALFGAVRLWRVRPDTANGPPLNLRLADLRGAHTRPMTPEEIEALRAEIESNVSHPNVRARVLGRLDPLSKEPLIASEPMLRREWAKEPVVRVNEDDWFSQWLAPLAARDYYPQLAEFLRPLACGQESNGFVALGTARRFIEAALWEDAEDEARAFARALLDPECKGGGELDDRVKAELQSIAKAPSAE